MRHTHARLGLDTPAHRQSAGTRVLQGRPSCAASPWATSAQRAALVTTTACATAQPACKHWASVAPSGGAPSCAASSWVSSNSVSSLTSLRCACTRTGLPRPDVDAAPPSAVWVKDPESSCARARARREPGAHTSVQHARPRGTLQQAGQRPACHALRKAALRQLVCCRGWCAGSGQSAVLT